MGRKKMDLIGRQFGRLTVIEDAGRNKHGQFLWFCKCSCGNELVVIGDSLRNGNTKSCGCLQKERTSEEKKVDLAGQQFGRLLVLEDVGINGFGSILWKCVCNCGTKIVIVGSSLRKGDTKSCGCLQKERVSQSNKINLKGRRFGRLVVIKEVGKRNKKPAWFCKCDCGVEKIVRGNDLRNGSTKSCGCLQRDVMCSMIGPLSSNWKGGIACEPYCDVWLDKEFKESIKQRDGYKCLNPGCWKTSNRLTGHHIDYNKKNCNPNNLITLCTSCNSCANKDREWHTAWYQAIMYRRCGYNYEL